MFFDVTGAWDIDKWGTHFASRPKGDICVWIFTHN